MEAVIKMGSLMVTQQRASETEQGTSNPETQTPSTSVDDEARVSLDPPVQNI